MEEFIYSSGNDRIVIFSLGSLVKKMPKEMNKMIASALAQIASGAIVVRGYNILEIDRFIVFPIFFLIFKYFTIIGYRFCNIGFIDKCPHLVVVLRIARMVAIAARLRGDETTTTTVACTGTWFAVVSKLYLTITAINAQMYVLNKCLICSLCSLALRNRDKFTESRKII